MQDSVKPRPGKIGQKQIIDNTAEITSLRVLLICDSESTVLLLQSLALDPLQRISMHRVPISEAVSCSIDDVDVVIVDLAELIKEGIDPADLGDVLYYQVPVVLFGQNDISTQAIDGIRAGAQCWLSSDGLNERPLFDALSQARHDFCQRRDLVTSHAKYKAVVDDQTELICRYIPDTGFTLTFVNQVYAKQLGYTAIDLEGQPLFRFFLKRNQEVFLNKFCSLTPDFPDITYDCRNLIDGDVYWTQWTDKAIYDSNGSILEVQSVGVDVTARRSAEQRALDMESNFHKFFHEVPVLMQELDPRGNIVNVNRCWCETMGYSADAVIDTHFYHYLLVDSRQQAKSAYATLLSQRWVKDVTCSFVRCNGEKCNVMLSVTAEFDAHEEIQRFLVVSIELAHANDEKSGLNCS